MLIGVAISCQQSKVVEVDIIPVPVEQTISPGVFSIDKNTVLYCDNESEEIRNIAGYFASFISNACGFPIEVTHEQADKNFIHLRLGKSNPELGTEGYKLHADKNHVNLLANKPAGLFYGIQSLIQMLPPEIYSEYDEARNVAWDIPCTEIIDYPRFPYRGMHLDVSRHFFPAPFIKKFIDLIAMYKMNRFHWHLTDDNGWRIEIKKYPGLQEISAWHVDRDDMHWREVTPPEPGEKATVGGFYTQEEVKEIVEYARERYITIIPEIELPGHTSEVLAAYPELSCTGGPFYVQPGSYWPNVDIFCAGNEKVFEFLEGVFDEVIELFPSEYIHIGGDEATKTNWENCPKCQKRIKKEGLKDEHELQSYFVKRIEKYLNSKGKQIIGWDEILEGGLAPGATVMSWRGVKGGIEAARQGHDVIMTPTSHCYFDYYQADPEFQPDAIGGFLTLRKVYSFEPIPEELNEEEAKYILGAQGNIWTEYISTPGHAEYMSVPRLCAIAEIDWSPKEMKDWDDFLKRINKHYKRFQEMGVNYCEGSFRVNIETQTTGEELTRVTLESEVLDPEIRYTLDGSDPTMDSPIYKEPFEIEGSVIVKAAVFRDGKLMERPAVKEISLHKAIGAKVRLKNKYHSRYKASGEASLVNGIFGTENHSDGQWLGFQGKDLMVDIDLGVAEEVHTVRAKFLENVRAWIFLPEYIEVQYSIDGEEFLNLGRFDNVDPIERSGKGIEEFRIDTERIAAQYLRVFAKNIGTCPEWHDGSGNPAWLFVDEIVVE